MSDLIETDVLIVGAGPAGLAAAIRLKQCSPETSVIVLEKGAEVGAHILSGAVLRPASLQELLPEEDILAFTGGTPVTRDRFLYYTPRRTFPLPIPRALRNEGNLLISLAALCRALARKAEALGAEIYTSFTAKEESVDGCGTVTGVRLGDTGVDKQGRETVFFQQGAQIRAKFTLAAEGAAGHLTDRLCRRYDLRDRSGPQTYGLGIKELWRLPEDQTTPGLAEHGTGYPLAEALYGGSFLYHMQGGMISIGYISGLDYDNPYFSPYEAFQRFKDHPVVRPLLEKGKRIGYGARVLNEGGFQRVPKLIFPGGALIGCSAGLLNPAAFKGIHNAVRSGMIAAECTADALRQERRPHLLTAYPERLASSPVMRELREGRNVRPGFRFGRTLGMAHAALDQFLLRGRAPWTLPFPSASDGARLKPAAAFTPPQKPVHDGKVTFDRLNSLTLSGVYHEESQPCHLRVKSLAVLNESGRPHFGGPEQYYCPAHVYEYPEDKDGEPRLQINASNCLHCKCCAVKDPENNILWTPPEGGGGPRYGAM